MVKKGSTEDSVAKQPLRIGRRAAVAGLAALFAAACDPRIPAEVTYPVKPSKVPPPKKPHPYMAAKDIINEQGHEYLPDSSIGKNVIFDGIHLEGMIDWVLRKVSNDPLRFLTLNDVQQTITAAKNGEFSERLINTIVAFAASSNVTTDNPTAPTGVRITDATQQNLENLGTGKPVILQFTWAGNNMPKNFIAISPASGAALKADATMWRSGGDQRLRGLIPKPVFSSESASAQAYYREAQHEAGQLKKNNGQPPAEGSVDAVWWKIQRASRLAKDLAKGVGVPLLRIDQEQEINEVESYMTYLGIADTMWGAQGKLDEASFLVAQAAYDLALKRAQTLNPEVSPSEVFFTKADVAAVWPSIKADLAAVNAAIDARITGSFDKKDPSTRNSFLMDMVNTGQFGNLSPSAIDVAQKINTAIKAVQRPIVIQQDLESEAAAKTAPVQRAQGKIAPPL